MAKSEASQREVVVQGGSQGFVQQLLIGDYRFEVDEPEELGGTGKGPTRLLEIANKCPVHKSLTSEIDIRTRLV